MGAAEFQEREKQHVQSLEAWNWHLVTYTALYWLKQVTSREQVQGLGKQTSFFYIDLPHSEIK